MALRLGFKINRYLSKNTFLHSGHTKAFSNKNPKLKFQPTNAASTLTQEQLERKLTNQNVNQISSIPKTTIIPSELENEPVIIRRKFAKSSTQIALTQPLKLSRLANPFPESVKTMPSDTVCDAEKARIMQEEVKMEARFHLQMQHENLQQQKLNKQFENQNQQSNNNVQQLIQPESSKIQQFQQLQQIKQPNFRKPKEYTELLKKEQGEINQSKKCAVNTSEGNAEERKEKRPLGSRCRRKSHTRAAKYLRHSWYPRHVRRQQREYSTAINPVIMSDIEQCELILRRLKKTHPQYRNLQKPLFIPGSKEEKKFIKNILRLIASHKTDQRSKTTAPFPSYSEVKSFKYDCTVQNINTMNKYPANNIKFGPGNNPRFYSTKKVNLCVPKPCPKFKLKGMKPAKCTSPKRVIQRKQEAPYPAYSEVCEDPLQDEPAEYTYCPWKADISSLLKTKSHLKHFSTAAGDSTEVELKTHEKEFPPPPACENPFPRVPQCDYEEQARKREEEKRKKHCPKKQKPDKNAKAASNIESGKIISKIKEWLSSYQPDSENIKITRSADDTDGRETYIIDVCEYEDIIPEQIRNKVDIKEEFETEIVEIIQPPPDIHHIRNPFTRIGLKRMPFKNMEYKPIDILDSHVSEMTQPIPVLTKNIPEFFSHSVTNVMPKKKTEELKLIQAKPIKQQNPVKTIPVNKISAESIPTKITPPKITPPKITPTKTIAAETIIAKTVSAKQIAAKTPSVKTIAAKRNSAKPIAAKRNTAKPIAAKRNAAKPIAAKRNAAKPVSAKPISALMYQEKTIPTKLESKQSETKTNVETKPKEILVNKVKENFMVKKPNANTKVNVVKKNLQFKTQNFEFNKVDKTKPVKKEEPKSKLVKKHNITTEDFKLLNIKDNIFNPYKDFKVNEMIENRRNPLSEPIYTKEDTSKGGCYKEPGCTDGLVGGCKVIKEEPPTKKCRFPKKKKVPSCDDVKNNKTRTCMPLTIPGLEDKPEYFINAPKKTYFKKSDNISNFINLHAEDINVLANQEPPKKDNYEPFKLKPQFWKK